MANSMVSYLWRDPSAPREFRSGVSLHSHTNQSKETLKFLAKFSSQHPAVRSLFARMERRSEVNHGMCVNYAAGYWTPPMTPRLALELESRQIEQLDVDAMVSLSDHDSISASTLLRAGPFEREIPISLEWSVPYGGVHDFHLGVHNLPDARATQWMQVLASYTAHPSDERLKEILIALNAEPDVLVVFNHPAWDLFLITRQKHDFLVNEFLQKFGTWLHALELNGLRNWDENRATCRLAEKWNMLLISGGDRHGVEPNANINLTNASSFAEFAHEIRCEKRSRILFMPQYAEPWKHRILRSTIDAVRDYPDFPLGSRTWDERVFHPDGNGVVRSLHDLWPNGSAPPVMRWGVAIVRLMGRGVVSSGLRMAWSDPRQLRVALGEPVLDGELKALGHAAMSPISESIGTSITQN